MFLIFTISLAALTSILAYVATGITPYRDPATVRQSIRALFEWIGASALFLTVNLTLGGVAIIIIRSITQHFIAVYDLDDPLIPILSAIQGFMFQRWHSRAQSPMNRPSR